MELIVADAAWEPKQRKPRANRPPDEMVYVRVGFTEESLRAKMKALGAIWRPAHKLWELPWGVVRGLGSMLMPVHTFFGGPLSPNH